MVERNRYIDFVTHLVLCIGVLVIVFPIYLAVVGATHSSQEMAQSPIPIWFGSEGLQNFKTILLGEGPGVTTQLPVSRMMWVSLVTALCIAFGKITISLLSAFAIVYFQFPFRKMVFWGIFVTLMLPVEVRIVPTYKVIADFGMVNSFAGLTIPLIASATATFLFRQFFLTVPDELAEAAKMDGAKPMRFFWDVLLPLSRTSMAALFVIQFIYGWNQYLWPLLMSTEERMYPIVMGIRSMTAGADSQVQWNLVMATAILALLPPALVVVFMQKWFIKGLVDTEK
jgi:sn-glycerol 3-phosphate transport system permease protein